MIAIGLAGVALLFALLLARVPVAFALLLAAAAGILYLDGPSGLQAALVITPYEHIASYTLSTLPMFILMAEFLTAGRFTRDLFSLAHTWLGHLRGGVAYAALAGGVLLAAMSGSSTAAASTLAAAAYPEMRRYGYRPGFSAATLAVIGTLAIMIPPSLGLILYAVFTANSIGALLLAGVVPGLLTALCYSAVIAWTVRADPEAAPRVGRLSPARERRRAVLAAQPVLLLLAAVLFALYSGVITPGEVGAAGALGALVLAALSRRMGMQAFFDSVGRAARGSAMVLSIIAAAAVFGLFLTLSETPQALLALIADSGLGRWPVLLIVLAVLLILGFFLDQLAILLLTLPLTYPLLTGLGFDPIRLGVLLVKTAEIGLISPPMGLNVFVVSGVTRIPVTEVFRGVWPFVLVELGLLAVLIAVPALSGALPALLS